MRGGLCGKLHGRPSVVDLTPAVVDPIAGYLSRIAILPTPPAFDVPIRGSPPEYCHDDIWYGKTRIKNGEKSLSICLFVWTEYTNVTDTRTGRQADTARRHRPRLCIASRGLFTENGRNLRIIQLFISGWSLDSADRSLQPADPSAVRTRLSAFYATWRHC